MILSSFYNEDYIEVRIEDGIYDYELLEPGLCYDGIYSTTHLSEKGKEYFNLLND